MNTVETKVSSLWSTDSLSTNRKQEIVEPDKVESGMTAFLKSVAGIIGPKIAIDVDKESCRNMKWDGSNHCWQEDDAEVEDGSPSKFFFMCLNLIQDALQREDGQSIDYDYPYYAYCWGFEFWLRYSHGKDVLEMQGSDDKIMKLAWIISTAADTISRKENEGVPLDDPFLLYLVASEEDAYQVLDVCKPLEEVGIYTVFLDSKFSTDLQVQSIKTFEPEFVISTPEVILKLLSMKAIDISGLSLMIVDGLEEAPSGGSYLDAVKSLRQFVFGNVRTACLCNCTNTSSSSAGGSVCK